jgi:hypothetical protein
LNTIFILLFALQINRFYIIDISNNRKERIEQIMRTLFSLLCFFECILMSTSFAQPHTLGVDLYLSHGQACQVGNQIYCYATVFNNDATHPELYWRIFLYTTNATGPDAGINWTEWGEVLRGDTIPGSSDFHQAGYPGVWYVPKTSPAAFDSFYLVYEGSEPICLATSTDGKQFTKDTNNPILSPEATGHDSGGIGTRKLFRENGMWYMFYHGYEGAGFGMDLNLAFGSDIRHLSKYSQNPILPTTPNRWDSHTTSSANIFKRGNTYYMIYEGCNCGDSAPAVEDFGPCTWGTGLAKSNDLFHWVRSDKPLVSGSGLGLCCDGPIVISANNVLYAYHRGFASDGGMETHSAETVWNMKARRTLIFKNISPILDLLLGD